MRGLPAVGRLPRWCLAVLVVASALDEGTAFLPAGALESFRAEVGLDYGRAGSVLSALALGSVLGSVGAAAADHVSRRLLAAGGALGLAVAMGAFALAPSYEVLVVASALHGLAATVMLDATSVALADAVGEAELRPFLARANLAGVAGDVAGPLLLGAVLGLGWSWRLAFALAAAAVAAYGLALAAAPLPAPGATGAGGGGAAATATATGQDGTATGEDGAGEGGRHRLATLRAVVADPLVWALALLSLLAAPLDEPLLGFLLALAEERGLEPGALTALALVTVAGGIVVYTVVESHTRQRSDAALVATGAVAVAAGTLAAGAVPHPGALLAGGSLAGSGLALVWLGLEHRLLTLRPGQRGTTLAVVGAVESLGFLLPTAVGALVDATTLAVGVASHALLALLIAAGAWALRRRVRGPGERGQGRRLEPAPWPGEARRPQLRSARRRSIDSLRALSSEISCSGDFDESVPQHSQPQPQASLALVTAVIEPQPHPQVVAMSAMVFHLLLIACSRARWSTRVVPVSRGPEYTLRAGP